MSSSRLQQKLPIEVRHRSLHDKLSQTNQRQLVESTLSSSPRPKSPLPSMALHTPFSVLSIEPLSVHLYKIHPATTNTLQAAVEVEELETKDPALTATIKSMNERGIKTLYGRWLIDGAPRVLLFDTSTGYYKLDEWKGDLWSTAGIPSPPDDSETNEAIVFGYLIAWFLGEVSPRTQAVLPLANLFSTSTTKKSAQSLPNSTSGLLV